MRIDILTLFPDMFKSVFSESIIKRARERKLIDIRIHNLRDWTRDRHKTADDRPFGGGPGMVLKPEPIFEAIEDLLKGGSAKKKLSLQRKYIGNQVGSRRQVEAEPRGKKAHIILLTPQGKKLSQKITKKTARYKHVILICGHYEGVDERVRSLAREEISIGDYILTCGELPAMVLVDAVTRLIPGALGDEDSKLAESFEKNLLEYPQYTRPAEYRGMKVPEVLRSGNHKAIEVWRRKEALRRTRARRPDLLTK